VLPQAPWIILAFVATTLILGLSLIAKHLSTKELTEILERTKGGRLKWGGYEQAWKEITKVHGDLTSLPPSELYERYCFREFQERLSEHLEARSKRK